MRLGGPRTQIVARHCRGRCWKENFSGVGVAGRCRRKSGTCWIEWSNWWPNYPLFWQSAVLQQTAQRAGIEAAAMKDSKPPNDATGRFEHLVARSGEEEYVLRL